MNTISTTISITTRLDKGPWAAAALCAVLGSLACFSAGCSIAGPAPTPPAAELFQLCAQCHGEGALGNQKINTPSIAGLPKWYIEAQLKKFKAGGRGTHFDDLSGMQMRPMAMSLASEDEISTIAGYVSSLTPQKPEPTLSGGDAGRGKTLYAVCIACHQADGAGSEALKAPPLTHANDWYMLSSLKKFKAGIRGTNKLDTSGALMRPMAQTLADEQAMQDVLAYVATLQK